MKRKISKTNSITEDIELPLLLEENTNRQTTSTKVKSHFIDYFNSDSPPTKYTKKMPLLKFITLFDNWSLVKLINAKSDPLTVQDLPLPFEFCNLEKKIVALDAEWTSQQVLNKRPSIIKATLKAFKK